MTYDPGLYDDVLAGARDASTRAASLLDVAGLSGNVLEDATTLADALAEAAEGVYGDRRTFSDALIVFLRFVAREGDPPALDRAVRALLAEDAIDSDAGVDTVYRAGLVGALSIVTVRRDYAARQDATAARTAFSTVAEPVIEQTGDVLGYEAHAWLANLVGQAAIVLSRLAADRAPLVRVETGLSMPATRLAYDLYGDPDRAAELVERNGVSTPCFMPVRLEALSS